MKTLLTEEFIELDVDQPIWDRFYMVAPLVVIGTVGAEKYDLAPKHMAMPMGWNNYFGFVCTPRHSTYQNIKQQGAFTVSFPKPDQVLLASLTASQRIDRSGNKPILEQLETIPAEMVDGVFLKDSYLYLECNMERILDGFGDNSLIIGEVVASYVYKNALRMSDVDDQQLLHNVPILAYLPPNRFAQIQETFSFPFPANFEK